MMLPTIQRNLYRTADIWKQRTGKRKREDQNGAIIYLSPATEDEDDDGSNGIFAVPLYHYALEIPRSISSISILMSPRCANAYSAASSSDAKEDYEEKGIPAGTRFLQTTAIPHCEEYGQSLLTFLSSLYPRADVTLEIATSTAESYARMIFVKHLVCPPGLGCLLPALTRAGASWTSGKYATIIGNEGLYPWFRPAMESLAWKDKDLSSSRNHLEIVPADSIPVWDTSMVPSGEDEGWHSFLKIDPPPTAPRGLDPFLQAPGCNRLRGRLGHWVQDNDNIDDSVHSAHARQHAPPPPLLPTTDLDSLYQPSPTWTWAEDVYPTCALQFITPESFCRTIQALNIRRFFFVGDESSHQQAIGLWNLLRMTDEYGIPPRVEGSEGTWQTRHFCRSPPPTDTTIITATTPQEQQQPQRREDAPPYEFVLEFVRNDKLNGKRKDMPKSDRGCDLCLNNWVERYRETLTTKTSNTNNNGGRTVLIANMGLHHHDMPTFRKDFDTFLELVEEEVTRTYNLNNRAGRAANAAATAEKGSGEVSHQQSSSSPSGPEEMILHQDIVLFRTALPGHEECRMPGIGPYLNYRDYARHETSKFGWDRFISYNDYVDGVLDERRWNQRRRNRRMQQQQQQQQQEQFFNSNNDGATTPIVNDKRRRPPTVVVDMLDVFPMTVLRPDGHMGGSDLGGTASDCTGVDCCLHYSLEPGRPVDYWNHLLYSQLVDLARVVAVPSVGVVAPSSGM